MNNSHKQSDNARIAKNTIALYVRMLFILVLSLYTSRITLIYIGVEDYGIYNVVGGVIATLSFLKATLSSASQRFLTFELGRGKIENLKLVFANNISVHLILCFIVLAIGETIGLWFLNTQMNIPPERMTAANIVFQCSLCSFVLTLLNVPYNGLIIAHERMGAFAYISIIEAVLKLIIVYLLAWGETDRLVLYSILWLFVCICIQAIYLAYSFRYFEESRVMPRIDKKQFKLLLSFSGYNLCEIFANMMADQGVNILLNLHFGPIINAARGIAVQVNNAINGFTSNFGTAINPQITKNYASNDKERMWKLVSYGNRVSFFLLAFLATPLFFKINSILDIWLDEVPLYSGIFIQLMILTNLNLMPVRTFYTAIAATGDIKVYQISFGLFRLLVFPACWFSLNFISDQPYIVYIVILIFEIAGTILKMYLLKRQFSDFNIPEYLRTVVFPCLFVSIPLFLIVKLESNYFSDSVFELFSYIICSYITSAIIIYFIGLDAKEKGLISGFITKKIKKS